MEVISVDRPGNAKRPSRERKLRAISTAEIKSAVAALSAAGKGDIRSSDAKKLAALRQLAEAGGLQTLEPLLPLALTLDGEPYTIADHYPFSPLYRTMMPREWLAMTGRQVAKTTNMAAHGVMLSACIPNFKTLFVCPLYEQIRRFSNNYVRPFIDRSPIRSIWTGTSTENSVLQRSFKNYAKMLFSFAFLDVSRIRGVSADRLAYDEVQDFDPGHFEIINECLSHSNWGLLQYTGTPLTLDNPIEGLWRRSSRAEWFVPCRACNEWNIPSLEYHLEAMIGPLDEFIGPERPALVCHKCRKPIDPRPPHGRWVHRNRDQRWVRAGFHIPQVILPLHCCRYDKWATLLAKSEGWGNTSRSAFCNEILGESVDVGQKLVTETDLRRAATLPWKNAPNRPDPMIRQRLPHYKMRILAVDWGGGGEQGTSFTALAVLGLTPTNVVHCLWGKRLVISIEHLREAGEILHWLRAFRCDLLAHDYTGAGIVRETVLVQAGFDLDHIMPVQYVRTATRGLMQYIPGTVLHNRAHYRLDKARSLLYTCQAIKLNLLHFFEYDSAGYGSSDNAGLLADFLALVEEKRDGRQAGDIYRITRNLLLPDDFAQAVNIGCCALWHANQCWPNFAAAANVARITAAAVRTAGNAEFGWDEDQTMRGFMNNP